MILGRKAELIYLDYTINLIQDEIHNNPHEYAIESTQQRTVKSLFVQNLIPGHRSNSRANGW